MSALTNRLGLYKPGGGLTGLITPDEVADIDKINSNMDKIDEAVGLYICTSTTRPAAPFGGQPIYETDTKNQMYWNGTTSAWVPVGLPNASGQAARDAIYPTPVGGEQVYRVDTDSVQRYVAATSSWQTWESGWITDAPTLTGSSVGTGGSAQHTQQHRYEHGSVRVKGRGVLGTTGASMAGGLVISLPVAAVAPLIANEFYAAALGTIFDAGNSLSKAWARYNGTAVNSFSMVSDVSGAIATITATAPFTWGAGDGWSYNFLYEAA